MAARTEHIEMSLATASAALANLQTERDDAVLDLINAPDNAQLATLLDQLRVEIPQAAGRVAELQSVLARARQADTIEARKVERARLQALRDKALAAARSRVTLAAQIDEAVYALGVLLDAWGTAGEPIEGQTRAMIVGACPDVDTRLRYTGDLLRLADGSSHLFMTTLLGQLTAAQLFTKGIPSEEIAREVLRFSSRSGASLAQTTGLAADRMARILSKFESMADDQLLAKPRAEVSGFAENEAARSAARDRAGSSVGVVS